MPLSVWPGLPGPGGTPDGAPCGGPVTAAAARRVIGAFSVPGDLVAAAGGCSPAVAEAAAAAGRPVFALVPGGRSGYPLSVPYPAARLRPPGRPRARPRQPGHRAGRAGRRRLLQLQLPRVRRPGRSGRWAAVRRLRAGAAAWRCAGRHRRPGRPGGTLTDTAGSVVAAARAAGLVYAQHIVLVRAVIDGDRLAPAAPGAGADAPGGSPVHDDLLVFTKPGGEPRSMTTARPEPAPKPLPNDDPELRLSVWVTAQRDARTQRRGRYLPESTAHPAKCCPRSPRPRSPGLPSRNLVADPMCGIGTTLVEAVHLGRDGLGIEYEDRWAEVAAANVAHARRQGAAGSAEVIRGDARLLPGLLPPGDRRAGRSRRHLPPYGPSVHGQVVAEQRRGTEGGVRKYDNRYGHDPANLASQGLDELLAGFTEILVGCAVLLRPGGMAVVTARPWRSHGELVDLPAAVIAAGARAGLVPVARCVALLAGLRGGRLIARPSFFQLDNLRRARRQRPALAPDRARGRADLPQPALSRQFGRRQPAARARGASRLCRRPGRVSVLPALHPAARPCRAARWRPCAGPDLTPRAESGVDTAGPGRKASQTSRSARKRPSSPGAAGPRRRPPPGTPPSRHLSPPDGQSPDCRGDNHGNQQQPARRPWPVPGTARLRAQPRQPRLARPRHRAPGHPGPARALRDDLPVLPGPPPRLPVRGQV